MFGFGNKNEKAEELKVERGGRWAQTLMVVCSVFFFFRPHLLDYGWGDIREYTIEDIRGKTAKWVGVGGLFISEGATCTRAWALRKYGMVLLWLESHMGGAM